MTTPARTILDLAGDTSAGELERMVARAFKQEITDEPQLRALIDRYPTRRGVARLRALLDAGSTPALTRSEAEGRFLDLVRKARLPAPRVNAVVAGFEVDFIWLAHRLVVEVDGFAFHSSRSSFESDRRRDAKLTALGFRVMRTTWQQLVHEPEVLLVNLSRATSAECRGDPMEGQL